jgi:hypothetical protein
MKNIFTHKEETIAASDYIFNNPNSFLYRKGNFDYYNVNGVIWEVYQSGTGNYPETYGNKYNN